MDAVARQTGTGRGVGAVGILTAGLVDRQRAYESLVTYSLAPWLAADYFAPAHDVAVLAESARSNLAGGAEQ